MLKRSLPLFLLSLFLFGFIAGPLEASSPEVEAQKDQKIEHCADSEEVAVANEDCDDCETEECAGKAGCCVYRCSSSYFLGLLSSESFSFENSSKKLRQRVLRGLKKYQSPFIDPALKPPMFS